jgi:DNA polymerase III gamma/tau subunit
VGRDLLFGLIEAVIAEDGPGAFALADRAVESGHDLKLVCRELSRVVRDMMVLSVDPERAGQGELADGERERLTELGKQFSREDLMRAFDLLANAEQDIRNASQPRYHFDMVLLKWMHLRKLVPLTELMQQLGAGKSQTPNPKPQIAPRTVAPSTPRTVGPVVEPVSPKPHAAKAESGPATASLKDAFLAEVRAGKGFFYNTVVAQAQRIDVTDDTITFTFSPTQRALKEQCLEAKPWLESAAERAAGRRISVTAVGGEVGAVAKADQPKAETPVAAGKRDLKAEAMSSSAVQAMLDVFPAEIRDVEEM